MSATVPPPTIWPGAPPSWCRPPTSVWPPCPPDCPPPAPWPAGLFRLNQCLSDVQEFQAFLTKVIKDLIAQDPSIIAVGTPVVGVTDATEAVPGMVGEFINTFTTIGFPASTFFQAHVTVASLPPGDWDLWWYSYTSVTINAIQARLDPLPTGFSGDMDMVLDSPTGGVFASFTVASPMVRALTSVANAMTFLVSVSPQTAAGTTTFVFNARRRR